MKASRDGVIPQLEPVGWLGRWQTRLGGFKRILQRSNFPMQVIIMGNTSITAWETSSTVRGWFLNDVRLYAASVILALTMWMVVYYSFLMPGEQGWGQTQSQRAERSPLKRDTEAIRERIDDLERRLQATDGGTDE